MGYQACDICGKNITNLDLYYLCKGCWDKEHLKSPSLPQPDELEKLIDECNDWIQHITNFSDFGRPEMSFVRGLKLLASRVRALETDKSGFESHINFVDEQLIKRVEALEELFSEHQKIKDYYEKKSTQENNPLTRNEIVHLIDEGVTGASLEAGECQLCKSIKLKLESYLETK